MIPTGLAIWIGSSRYNSKLKNPREATLLQDIQQWQCFAGLVLPRSGLGTRGLVLANTIGLIDEDYQGELKIAAWNRLDPGEKTLGYGGNYSGQDGSIALKAGDRVAQLMVVPVIKAQWEVVDDFSDQTKRGLGGFGSTG
jgi:dUTP pyrophosphatase